MRGSTPRANPLTEGEIGAVLGRIGLLASGDRLRCVPLDGGVSSDIWRIEIGAQKYCLKRALAQLKVSQIWEAPIERNDAEWKWLAEAEAIWPGSVPRLVAHDRDAGLFIMEYLDPERDSREAEQVGTVSEAMAAVEAARAAHWGTIVSARSGETEDVTIVHLAVGWGVL